MEHIWSTINKFLSTLRNTSKILLKTPMTQGLSGLLWTTLTLVLLSCSLVDGSLTMKEMCGVDSDWNCLVRDTSNVPREVMEVCSTCGAFWSNVPGLDLCCRCSPYMLDFCLDAVYGYGRR